MLSIQSGTRIVAGQGLRQQRYTVFSMHLSLTRDFRLQSDYPMALFQLMTPMYITWPGQAVLFLAVNELFMPDTAGEVLAFGACAHSKSLLPVMNNTIKSELATQHVTPGQHFLVMTTAGKPRCS